MAPPRAVLFDLDGTLIDSIQLILDSFHHTLEAHAMPRRSDAHWLAGVGTPLRQQLGACTDDPSELDALIATYRAYNWAHHDAAISPYPGVADVVAQLGSNGHPMAVVTSKAHKSAKRGLEVVGIGGIDVFVGADDVTNAKPDPEPVLAALDLLGARADDAVFVGDSVHDMIAGAAAGVTTAAALWGPFGRDDLVAARPDHWLDRPEDLLALVG